jgi:hypothetical protein
MPFVKLVKNRAYFKRFQVKYRRRRGACTLCHSCLPSVPGFVCCRATAKFCDFKRMAVGLWRSLGVEPAVLSPLRWRAVSGHGVVCVVPE